MTEANIEATVNMLQAAAQEARMFLSGDARVSASDAAALLGYSAKYLAQMRDEGKGPPSYAIGLNGARVSYRLSDLAAWIESRREFVE